MSANPIKRMLGAGACLAAACCATAYGDGYRYRYRFEAPGVLDLSVDRQLAPLKGAPIAAVPLAGDIARTILAAPEVGNDAPGQLPMLDGTDKAARKQEQARLAAEAPAVQRAGKTLTIKPQSGAAVLFGDRQAPKRADADQDGELFIYAGRTGAVRYHRVEERFQQDSPASYLVNPLNGKTLFATNGSYVVQLSPDGNWLLSMSPGDTRVLLVVMALDADGPRLALLCQGGTAVNAGPGVFKGWRDDKTFDLVLTPLVLAPGKPGQGSATTLPAEPIALRFTADAMGWQTATPDPKALERVGYACWR